MLKYIIGFGCIVVLILITLVAKSRRSTTIFNIDGPSAMTDEEVVRLSRVALQKYGKEPRFMRPYKYDGTNYFARNQLDPTRGYVLWDDIRSNYSYDYVVRVSRKDH